MRIAGVDEAGRGPLAGPVVAAAVIFPTGYKNPEIKDSKQLSAEKRDRLVEIIKRDALDYAIVAVGHHRIDRLNIRAASLLAMSLALQRIPADQVLIDGNALINTNLPQQAIIKGDQKFVQISAASILAKEYRDHLMVILDQKYPGFELKKHAGYPTKLHKEKIAEQGPSRIHRKTFKGVKEFL